MGKMCLGNSYKISIISPSTSEKSELLQCTSSEVIGTLFAITQCYEITALSRGSICKIKEGTIIWECHI